MILTTFSAATKKVISALIITGIFAIAVAAQTTDASQQGKRYGEPGFKGESINLNVVNADIRDILSYITDQYGINFVMDKAVGNVPVTVKVNDVPWNVALDSVLQAQELGVQVNGTILRVANNKTLATEGALLRERANNQLDTSPLVTELIRLNYATTTGGASPGGTTAGTATSSGGSEAGGASAGGAAAGGASGLLPIIKRRLSRRGSIEVDPRSNSLIVTDVPANIAAIKQLIALLDQPEPQVEIETRIVVASRNFSRDIGVQLTAILNGARQSGILGGTLPSTPVPPVLNNPNVPNPSIVPWAQQVKNTAIGLTTGIFGTAQLSAIITLGEQKGQAKVIATPRVTALNNRTAEIKSGTKIPITTIQPGAGGVGGVGIATTTYVDVPLRLQVTPQITDLGTVVLTVVAENSSTAIITGSVNPAINSQSMTTQVTVPDGGTTVVGGVLFDDERESQDRTPGLGSIPILGNLFKRKGVTRNTNEILFFITPRISRPDASQSGAAQSGPTIIQPVPMGNPPSNSTPVAPVTPGMALPEVVPSATPEKP